MEEFEDDSRGGFSKSEIPSPKLKKTLIAESDFYGETKIKSLRTTYTWSLKNFESLVKIKNHIDTTSFILNDDSNVQCFLSANFNEWMSIYLTFNTKVPPTHNYEITIHTINENMTSSFHEVAYARNIIKGDKVCFKKFLLVDKEESSNFLVSGNLFLLCEISRMDSTFICRNNVIECLENDIADDMAIILRNNLLTDVTLTVMGKEYRAHKCILAARSPVFLAMFQINMLENMESEIIIEDTDNECVEKMLQFIYSDKVDNIEKDTEKLLELSDKYDIKGLKLLCAQELCKNIDVDTALDVLVWSDKCNSPELRERAFNFIRNHMKSILESEAYNNFVQNHSNLLKELFAHISTPKMKKIKLEI
ncbi:protein roadkill-like [Leptopilina heterotoma]|uniref:protein roadkill-like n=1 Tax=Leptopilina heterotoma TaxID=63436 RepID=UPI001CA950C2|nr:protein roadkill-like [Leptopilina heterotoma]